MSDTNAPNKGMYNARVISNRRMGPHFYKLHLDFTESGAKDMGRFKAGQFVQVDAAKAALPSPDKIPPELADSAHRDILLRRPFSFSNVTSKSGCVSAELLYCVVGPATLRMTTLSADHTVSVIGPLGNGFAIPKDKKIALLVGGGMGTPPLQCLAQQLTARRPDIQAFALAGAKTAKELPFEGQLDEISRNLGFSIPEFARYGIESLVATDDGSVGFRGFVTDCLINWLDEKKPARETFIIYACGPEPMLARVAQIARQKNIDCQVSMERRMACGIGLCQSCAIECKINGSDETIYKLCCRDGPVFNAGQVLWT